jgi:hypothetical protein
MRTPSGARRAARARLGYKFPTSLDAAESLPLQARNLE